jgi:hypothetical protein
MDDDSFIVTYIWKKLIFHEVMQTGEDKTKGSWIYCYLLLAHLAFAGIQAKSTKAWNGINKM